MVYGCAKKRLAYKFQKQMAIKNISRPGMKKEIAEVEQTHGFSIDIWLM